MGWGDGSLVRRHVLAEEGKREGFFAAAVEGGRGESAHGGVCVEGVAAAAFGG